MLFSAVISSVIIKPTVKADKESIDDMPEDVEGKLKDTQKQIGEYKRKTSFGAILGWLDAKKLIVQRFNSVKEAIYNLEFLRIYIYDKNVMFYVYLIFTIIF